MIICISPSSAKAFLQLVHHTELLIEKNKKQKNTELRLYL